MIKVDQNYRICIPSHIRQKLHINKEDKVDIFINDKGNIEIIIDDNCKKYLSVSELKDTDYNKLVINIDGKYYAVDR